MGQNIKTSRGVKPAPGTVHTAFIEHLKAFSNVYGFFFFFSVFRRNKMSNTPHHKHTPSSRVLLFIRDTLTAVDFVWKVCLDDMTICSWKLVKRRAPEVPGPQRLLCSRPKAYLQAATSHAIICLVLVFIIMSAEHRVLKHPNAEGSQRSAAFSSHKA